METAKSNLEAKAVTKAGQSSSVLISGNIAAGT